MTTFPGLASASIAQIAVNVRDVERATGFYRDALGMRFLFAAPKMAFFQCGSTWLMLATPEEAEFDHPSSVLYFEVPDIDAAHGALQARGVEFRDAPHLVHKGPGLELWMAFFRDGEGNTHALRQNKAA